jgi:hypothetical protein
MVMGEGLKAKPWIATWPAPDSTVGVAGAGVLVRVAVGGTGVCVGVLVDVLVAGIGVCVGVLLAVLAGSVGVAVGVFVGGPSVAVLVAEGVVVGVALGGAAGCRKPATIPRAPAT